MLFTQLIRAKTAIILVAVLALSGCSGMRLVDSDVTAFSAWSSAPPGPNTRYRFERLPSQISAGADQDKVEAIATTSLAKVGMALSLPDAKYAVQVVAATEVLQRYSDSGFGVGGPGGVELHAENAVTSLSTRRIPEQPDNAKTAINIIAVFARINWVKSIFNP